MNLHQSIRENDYVYFITHYTPGKEEICKGLGLLHSAAISRHIIFASILLKDGFNPLSKNQWGGTPLHMAAQAGNLAVLNVIIEAGGYHDNLNYHYKSPLAYAIASSPQCTERLLDLGSKMQNVHNCFIYDWVRNMVKKQNNTKRTIVSFMVVCKRTKAVHKDLVNVVALMIWQTRREEEWEI